MPKLKTATAVSLTLLATLLIPTCGPKVVEQAPPLPASCPAAGEMKRLRWYQVSDRGERKDLLRWCAAVGPAVIGTSANTGEPMDSLAVVTWNTHVGGGSLGYFIRQLRTGVLTAGRPVRHFVVMLQETFRDGYEVPAALPAGALSAEEIFPTRELGVRRDVQQVAQEEGLHVFYVPSMRNGVDKDPPEDRGNAILSTLPLTNHTAWELPLRYQRRVSIGATVAGETTDGQPWRVSFINVHLDNRSGISSLALSFSRARVHQTEFVLDNLPFTSAAVLGGDLNTWLGEGEEPAVRMIHELFTEPERTPVHGTLKFGAVMERQTDFLFFRLPHGWRARYRRIDGTYGSDHYPLIGWVVFPRGDDAEERGR
jgi:endonuclease/exonuclease/phosphatase family metal-dependent hydrolase